MLGFTPDGADAERALEAKFDANLSAGAIDARLKTLAAAPNEVGSPHDKANAEFVLAQLKSWGWDAHIEVFQVLYPTPIHEALELVGPTPFSASLNEPRLPGDATSAIHDGALPPYAIYGADGDVTGEVIYVNQGMPDDYKALARMGVDVTGKIVIARYGGGWRGLKPKLAQEHGAIGCIIYSDPADDGYGAGDAYPAGGWRPDEGVQRGSVLDMPVEPGDPLTPGIGAVPGAPRIAIAEAKTILKIPVLPISWADAKPFLAALGGETAPKAWRGALPLTYHTGPGPARAHLVVQSGLEPEAALRRDRDAARRRAAGRVGDPRQPPRRLGVRRLGPAVGPDRHAGGGQGHRRPGPDRLAAKADHRLRQLGRRGAGPAWIDRMGGDARGRTGRQGGALRQFRFQWPGLPVHRRLLFDPAADRPGRERRGRTPETGVSGAGTDAGLHRRARASTPAPARPTNGWPRPPSTGPDLPIAALGSGLDYTPFVQHLGIASINLEFTGEEEQGGVYHSQYDTFEHYARFGDPGFRYGVALAQTAGRLVLRAADADVVPLRFGELAADIGSNLDELHELTTSMRAHADAVDRLLDMKAFTLAARPDRTSVPPPREDAVPAIDFTPLDAAVTRLKASADAYDQALAGAGQLSRETRAQIDSLAIGVEHALSDPRGLPGRPWYKHLIYAPGLLTGYGAKTLPGVREAIEGRRWDEAADYIARTTQAIDAASKKIDAATAVIKGGGLSQI